MFHEWKMYQGVVVVSVIKTKTSQDQVWQDQGLLARARLWQTQRQRARQLRMQRPVSRKSWMSITEGGQGVDLVCAD